jgi:DNA-binding transcriptional MerR regulator
MFRIGDFSRIARVSTRLLRFYDEIGLFGPAHVDPQSGYRSYTVVQLAQLNRILVLKELGFNLDQVREIMGTEVTPSQLRNMLVLRRNDVEQTLAAEAQRLRNIEMRIAQLESEGSLPEDDVIVRAEPARRLLSLRRKVASFAAARELMGELRNHARDLFPKGKSRSLVAIGHSTQFEPDDIDVEVGFAFEDELAGAVPRGSPLQLRELEAVERMAVCVRVGLPEHAHLVTARIGRLVEANGDELAGPSREFFLKPPDPERMHESVVEMQFPLRKIVTR